MEKGRVIVLNTKRCGIIWMLFSLITFIIGIIVLVCFAKYINKTVWQRGVGITGIVILLLGALAIIIGLVVIWSLRNLLSRQEDEAMKNFKHRCHRKSFPTNLYPRQSICNDFQSSPHYGAGGYPADPGANPSVPQAQDAKYLTVPSEYKPARHITYMCPPAPADGVYVIGTE